MWSARAKRRGIGCALLLIAGTCLTPVAARAESDPKAVEIAEAMMEAMGGREAFDAQEVMAFRFSVRRDDEELSNWLHVWNRFDGRYRLEGKTREGEFLRVLFDLDTKEGEVWVGDRKLPAGEAASYLDYAYGRYINDTYWFLMPWKWLDPGVHLTYQGEKTVEGQVFDVVHLAFDDGTGITSGDQYWGYVSRDDRLMKRWEYLLQNEDGSPGTGDRTAYLWDEWREAGDDKLLFSHVKNRIGDDRNISIVYPLLRVTREADDDLFSPPPPPATAPPAEPSGTPPAEAGLDRLLIVLNKSEHTAALVDPESGEVVRKVPTGIGPHEAAVSRDGKTLYVTNYGTQDPGNSLSMIDLPSGTVKSVKDLGENARPHGILVDASGDVWVTTEDSKSLLRLDGELNLERKYVTGQEISHMVALSPDGSHAFTADIGSGTVTVVDVESGDVRHVETGDGPEGIDVSPDGKEVWVANRGGNDIVILDPGSLEILATLGTGEVPIRVKFTPDGKRVLVSCAGSNELAVYDRKGRKEVDRVALDAVPVGILVAPDGKTAYVANTGADKVSIIDMEKLVVTGSIHTGREPDGLAWTSW